VTGDSPLYDLVLALHIASALAGFGALALTGVNAAAARRLAGRPPDERLRRYFRPGRNWAARALFLVPVFGALLLLLHHGADARHPFPWIGLGLWLVATGLASAVVWPGERAVQAALAPGAEVASDAGLAARCRQVERAATLTSALFVLAVAVMIAQPG